MFLEAFVILLASSQVKSDDLDFDVYDYAGDISQSILRLYYGKTDIWPRQPKACYGVLVDWKIALFPCSCLSYTKDDKQTDRPWRHAAPVANENVDVGSLEVGTMFEEYNPRYGNDKVKVVRYVQDSSGSDEFKCKSDLLYEWTAVELQRRINFTRLIWIPTANRTLMRNLTEETIMQTGIGCRVVYWDAQTVNDSKTGKTREIYRRLTNEVFLSPWPNCNDTVCPVFEELRNYKVNITNNTWTEEIPSGAGDVKQDQHICRNELKHHYRSCVGWRNGPSSICALVPGTPVVCDSNRLSGGIIGTITNATIFCPTEGLGAPVAPINLFAEGLSLVERHLRIVNAPGYSGFFALPPKGPSRLFIQARSPACRLMPVSVFTMFALFNCIIAIPPFVPGL